MLVAHDSNQNRIWAREIDREDGPFFCPICNEPLRLHKGNLRVHHFAHLPNATCTYGAGESEAHRRAKESIYLAFQQNGTISILEAPLGDLRPDIMAIINNEIVGIEVQASSISLEEITRRTIAYSQRAVAVVWLICEPVPTANEQARFKWQHRFLHGMYFGRVYYYGNQDKVIPVHLQPSYGYSDGGEYGGGGTYRHKTIKVPTLAPIISLSDTNIFHSIYRKPWSYTTGETQIDYPASKIWIDQLPKWWSKE